MASIVGVFLHVITTVSALLFGGSHPPKQVPLSTVSKNIHRETRDSHTQKKGISEQGQFQKIGKGGESRGISPRPIGRVKSQKRSEEAERPPSEGIRNVSDVSAPIPIQTSSSSSPQEDLSTRDSMLGNQKGDSDNKTSTANAPTSLSDSSTNQLDKDQTSFSTPQGNIEKGTSAKEISGIYKPGGTEIFSSSNRSSKDNFTKTAFIKPSQKPPESLNIRERNEKELSRPLKEESSPLHIIPQEQQAQGSLNTEDDTSKQKEAPLPPPLDPSQTPSIDSDLFKQARETPLPEPPDDTELPPIPEPPDQVQGNLRQLEEEALLAPRPAPLIQSQSGQEVLEPSTKNLEEQESPLLKALKEKKLKPVQKSDKSELIKPSELETAKKKLKPTPELAPQEKHPTEAQVTKNKLRAPVGPVKAAETSTNPFLLQVQQGLKLKETTTGKLVRQEEEKRRQELNLQQQELKTKGLSGPTLEEIESKLRVAKEKKRLEEEQQKSLASAHHVSTIKEVEINKAVGARNNLFDAIRTFSSNTLKSVKNRILNPISNKDEKTLIVEEANKEILARRQAIQIDDEMEKEEQMENEMPNEGANKPVPQAREEIKTIEQTPVKSGKSLQKALDEKFESIKHKLPVHGRTSSKEEDDDDPEKWS